MKPIDKIINLLHTLITQMYTGCVIVHFNKGQPCKLEKRESLKL